MVLPFNSRAIEITPGEDLIDALAAKLKGGAIIAAQQLPIV
jgi:hypothetical protein